MCAEAVWWRCHRRIIADYLLTADERVMHILGPSHVDEASLTPGAVARGDGAIIYPAEVRLGLKQDRCPGLAPRRSPRPRAGRRRPQTPFHSMVDRAATLGVCAINRAADSPPRVAGILFVVGDQRAAARLGHGGDDRVEHAARLARASCRPPSAAPRSARRSRRRGARGRRTTPAGPPAGEPGLEPIAARFGAFREPRGGFRRRLARRLTGPVVLLAHPGEQGLPRWAWRWRR